MRDFSLPSVLSLHAAGFATAIGREQRSYHACAAGDGGQRSVIQLFRLFLEGGDKVFGGDCAALLLEESIQRVVLRSLCQQLLQGFVSHDFANKHFDGLHSYVSCLPTVFLQ